MLVHLHSVYGCLPFEVLRPYGPQSHKDLPPGPSQAKFAGPSLRGSHSYWSGEAVYAAERIVTEISEA